MTKPTGRPRGRPRKDGQPEGQWAINQVLLGGSAKAGDVCPRCHTGTLTERIGQYGAFVGCSEFPICRYSHRLPPAVSQATGTAPAGAGAGEPGGSQTAGQSDPSQEPQGQEPAGEPEPVNGEPGAGAGQSEPDPSNEPAEPDPSNEPAEPDPSNEPAEPEPDPLEPPPVPAPFVPQSPIEELIAEIARKVASGLDVEVLNTVREAMREYLANVQTATPQALPEPALPAGIQRIKIPAGKNRSQSANEALAQRIVKRLRSGPVMLIGPSGCGKSHIAGMAAEILGVRFGGISFSTGIGEGSLIGRLIPLAPDPLYLSTEFVDFFDADAGTGGLFLADELDSADAGVTLTLNQAIANGRLPLPHRFGKPYAMKHPDFYLIGTMNTDGRGQSRTYQRNVQDGAFLDRFIGGYFRMEYDRELELKLCLDNGGSETLAAALWAIRERAIELRLEDQGVLITTRAFIRGAQLMRNEDLTAAEATHEILQRFSAIERQKLLAGAV